MLTGRFIDVSLVKECITAIFPLKYVLQTVATLCSLSMIDKEQGRNIGRKLFETYV